MELPTLTIELKTHARYTSDLEEERIRAFQLKHHRHETRVSFQSAGVGNIVRVHCVRCRRCRNVTDYECW